MCLGAALFFALVTSSFEMAPIVWNYIISAYVNKQERIQRKPAALQIAHLT
jgi:hypothetical protein